MICRQITRLQQDILRHAFVASILRDEQGILLAGHGRVELLVRMYSSEVMRS
jgi:hypothetical protein